MKDEKIDLIKGAVLVKMEVLEGETTLRLTFNNNSVIKFEAEGDCCSNSWIEHFDEVKEPCTVLDMIEVEIYPTIDPIATKTTHYEEEMKYYFYEIKTDKGSLMIEMRNSSNGYYGGWLE